MSSDGRKCPAGEIQVCERQQREHLGSVLGDATIAHLAIAELALHAFRTDQLATDGLRKAPMPSNDFNTRIVLFGHDSAQARALADAVGKTPFQNVSYFPGTFDALAAAVKTQ